MTSDWPNFHATKILNFTPKFEDSLQLTLKTPFVYPLIKYTQYDLYTCLHVCRLNSKRVIWPNNLYTNICLVCIRLPPTHGLNHLKISTQWDHLRCTTYPKTMRCYMLWFINWMFNDLSKTPEKLWPLEVYYSHEKQVASCFDIH